MIPVKIALYDQSGKPFTLKSNAEIVLNDQAQEGLIVLKEKEQRFVFDHNQ